MAPRLPPTPFTGRLLSRELDDDLQRCVEEAAREVDTPIALATLVLERSQFFRAHHGLPDELAVARATDRDASFCQFVVQHEGPFEVENATDDERVPKELVERYGIRAYLGYPLVANEQVIGSLCVIDTERRKFGDAERDLLADIARRASDRLQILCEARDAPRQRLVKQGLAPAFAEVRNVLGPLKYAADRIRLIAADIAPTAAILESNLSDEDKQNVLAAQAPLSSQLEALSELAEDVASSYARLEPSILALQIASAESGGGAAMSTTIELGLELAHHSTKRVGGVSIEGMLPQERAACATSLGAAVVSLVLSNLATASLLEKKSGPLVISVDSSADGTTMLARVSDELSIPLLDDIVSEVATLLDSDATIAAERIELRSLFVSRQLRRTSPTRQSTERSAEAELSELSCLETRG